MCAGAGVKNGHHGERYFMGRAVKKLLVFQEGDAFRVLFVFSGGDYFVSGRSFANAADALSCGKSALIPRLRA